MSRYRSQSDLKMKKHIRLTFSLLLLLAVASFTLIPEVTLAVLGVYLAVALNLLIFRFVKLQRGFKVTRKVDRRQVMVGGNVRVSIGLSYDGSFPIIGSLGFRCESLGVNFDTGPLVFSPSQSNTYDYVFAARRRGAHKISPTVLNIRDWLLLSERTVSMSDSEEILVLPHIYLLHPNVIGAVGSRVRGVVSSGEKGRSSEIWGLREYQPWDDFKLISWKSMAKQPNQSPMTKVTVGEVGYSVTVIMDVGEDMAAPNGEYSNLDVAADLAASVCYSLVRGGTKTGLIFYDNAPAKLVRPERSPQHLESILRYLALVQPSLGSFSLTNLAKEPFPSEFGETFILITGRVSGATTHSFTNTLSKMKKHHQLILIIVHNEASKPRAENFQNAARKAGVSALLATSTTVQETLRTLELSVYASAR